MFQNRENVFTRILLWLKYFPKRKFFEIVSWAKYVIVNFSFWFKDYAKLLLYHDGFKVYRFEGLYSLSKELVACTVSLYKFGRKCNILSRMSLDIQFNVVLWMDDLIWYLLWIIIMRTTDVLWFFLRLKSF